MQIFSSDLREVVRRVDCQRSRLGYISSIIWFVVYVVREVVNEETFQLLPYSVYTV